jgi:hypothetical protein
VDQDPNELRRQIEHTRENLGRDVDALADKMSPRRMAERRWSRVSGWAGSVREAAFGTAGGAVGTAGGAVGRVGDAAGTAVERVEGAVQAAPQMAVRQTQGNPMLAGGLAFGVGFFASMVAKPTQAEARLAHQAHLDQMPAQLGAVASEVASTVQEAGRDAAETLKEDAAGRLDEVTSAVQAQHSNA